MAKKYADYTADEKAAYKKKRDAYWAKRETEQKAGFEKLEAELKKLNAPSEVMNLLSKLKGSDRSTGNGSTPYIVQIFGHMPEVGEKITIDQYNYGMTAEEVVAFVTKNMKMPDVVTRKLGLGQMIWYAARAGHVIVQNEDKSILYKAFNDAKAA